MHVSVAQVSLLQAVGNLERARRHLPGKARTMSSML